MPEEFVYPMTTAVPTTQPEQWPPLSQVLAILMDLLAGSSSNSAPVARNDKALSRWSDSDYVYIEVNLPHGVDLTSDVTFHDGKVFIRVQKNEYHAPKPHRRKRTRELHVENGPELTL